MTDIVLSDNGPSIVHSKEVLHGELHKLSACMSVAQIYPVTEGRTLDTTEFIHLVKK